MYICGRWNTVFLEVSVPVLCCCFTDHHAGDLVNSNCDRSGPVVNVLLHGTKVADSIPCCSTTQKKLTLGDVFVELVWVFTAPHIMLLLLLFYAR
jgi:hypothetical protein